MDISSVGGWAAAALVGAWVGTASAQGAAAPALLLTGAGQWEELQAALARDPAVAKAYAALLRRAEAEARKGPFSVMDKTGTPDSGDKHDYFSLGRYDWMDHGAVVRRDGLSNPAIDSDTYDKRSWEQLTTIAPDLALAYRLGGRADAGKRAALLLRTWFLDPQTRMNPNLNYAQCRFTGPGTQYGIIEAAHLARLLDAASLLDERVGWSPRDRDGLRAWAADFLEWLRTSPLGLAEGKAKNNHGTWYDAQVAALALYTGDAQSGRERLEGHLPELLDEQIAPDGSQPRELARTRSFSYSIFNLLAFFEAARVGDQVGVDVWRLRSAQGADLRKALDFLLPYLAAPSTWPHPQIDAVDLKPMVPILRRAAREFDDPRYAAALASLDADRDASDLLRDY